jgi:hypothetical protein
MEKVNSLTFRKTASSAAGLVDPDAVKIRSVSDLVATDKIRTKLLNEGVQIVYNVSFVLGEGNMFSVAADSLSLLKTNVESGNFAIILKENAFSTDSNFVNTTTSKLIVLFPTTTTIIGDNSKSFRKDSNAGFIALAAIVPIVSLSLIIVILYYRNKVLKTRVHS